MKKRANWLAPCIITALALVPAASSLAQDEFHARVSFDAGGTLIKGAADADWSHATVNTIVLGGDTLWVKQGGTSELEMAGGTYLRMADGSKAEIAALPPSGSVRADVGSFYVNRLRRSSGGFELVTPACAVEVAPDTMVRVDVTDQGNTCISVHWGRVTALPEGGEGMTATHDQRIYDDPGLLPSEPQPFSITNEDDFDRWNRERTATLVEGYQSLPPAVTVKESTVGVADLAPYGEWVLIGGRNYWHPTVVKTYVPYRTGHWSFVVGTGYVWCGDYPFSYVTTHYGRWIYREPYGWVWGYEPGWSPAWCATVHYGKDLLWSPIGFDGLPVVTGASATFEVGGVRFSLGASSYVPMSAAYYGGMAIRPVVPMIVENVPLSRIGVWNIAVKSYRNPVRVPYRSHRLWRREFVPRVIMRGPRTFAGGSVRADQAARSLQRRISPEAFRTPARARSMTRTRGRGSEAGRAPVRRIRLQPEQRVFRSERGMTVRSKPMRVRTGQESFRGRSGGASGMRESNPSQRTVVPETRSRRPVAGETRTIVPRSERSGRSGSGRIEPRTTVPRFERSGRSESRRFEPRTTAPRSDRSGRSVYERGRGRTSVRSERETVRRGEVSDRNQNDRNKRGRRFSVEKNRGAE